MELQQIKYFLALAQELHFWNTAEKMFITQSALSRQIKALEDELGVKLFERSKRNVKLTEAGVFLRDQWLPVLNEIHRIHRQAKKIHEGAYGSISIGYPGSISYGFLPALIASIAQALPELKVELVDQPTLVLSIYCSTTKWTLPSGEIRQKTLRCSPSSYIQSISHL